MATNALRNEIWRREAYVDYDWLAGKRVSSLRRRTVGIGFKLVDCD